MDGMRLNGYCYELTDHPCDVVDGHWARTLDDRWDVVMVSDPDKRAIKELGVRKIDGSPCMVFLCADSRVRAVTMVAAAARPEVRR